MRSLVDHFISERIISIEEKESISVDSLLHTVGSHLKSGINMTFLKMLDIMEQFGDLATTDLAKSIKMKLSIPNHEGDAFAVDFSTFDNVEVMFVALVSALRNMIGEEKFKMVRRECIMYTKMLSAKFPIDFINKIDATKTMDDLFDVLVNSPYCSWINIHLLEKMAAVATASLQSNRCQLIDQYKNVAFSKKLKYTIKHIPKVLDQVTGNYYSKIKQILKKDFDDVTVEDVISQCYKLEKNFDIEESTLLLDCVVESSVEFHWLIPTELVCHARHSAFKNWHQLDDVLYLDICDHIIKPSWSDIETISSSAGIFIFITIYIHPFNFVLCS